MITKEIPWGEAGLNDYCYIPPTVGQAVPPNVMLVIDVSGSMGWRAYSGQSNTGQEEGYFEPDKIYEYRKISVGSSKVSKDVDAWVISNSTSYTQCPSNSEDISTSNKYKGSCLNFYYMRRIDLVRWALTGGTLDSCNSTVDVNNPSFERCNPMAYGQPGDQTSCNSTGCLLKTYGGVRVFARWNRINGTEGGLLFQLRNYTPQPRFGLMEYSADGKSKTFIRQSKVYIGDFTGSANFDALNPYKNVITAINAENPNGYTPTGPALWDVYNYFSQKQPQFGGLVPDTGGGNPFKNYMYQCVDKNNDGNCQGNEFVFMPCAKNFVILLTDGQWNTGRTGSTICTIDDGYESLSADPVVPAYFLHKKGFNNTAANNTYSYVEALYGIGLWLGGTGEQSLKNVAMYGGFDRYKTWPDDLTGYPQGICSVDDCSDYIGGKAGKGSPCTPLPPSTPDWDKDGNGIPDTFFSASDAKEIKNAMMSAILDILRRSSSGATVATLTSRRGFSSLVLQPLFYPRFQAGDTEVNWIGMFKAFWTDFKANLREDTNLDKWLNLKNVIDKIFQPVVQEGEQPQAWLISNETTCSAETRINANDLKPLFDAGCKLANTNPSERKIYLHTGNSSVFPIDDNNAKSFLKTIWQGVSTSQSLGINVDDNFTRCLIDYLKGNSTISCLNNATVKDYFTRLLNFDVGSLCGSSGISGQKRWKLGDIIYSTPSVLSHEPLNIYHVRYFDFTYRAFISSDAYEKRTTYAFIGANDGMLHAFRVGYLIPTRDQDKPFRLIDAFNQDTTSLIGREEWTFIPKYAVPYLIWYGHKDYCHIPTIDYRTYVFDASIGGGANEQRTSNSWRTLLIGVMGFGGKAIQVGSETYSSSIFVLDLTDWLNGVSPHPQVLWEKPIPDNTLTLSFPAIIRLGERDKNGKWYLVIGSGPKNPQGTEFVSQGKLYFFDLRTGDLVKDLGEASNQAIGDIMPVDVNNDYQDDVLYFGTYSANSGNFYRLSLRYANGTYKDVSNLSNSDISQAFTVNAPVFSAPSFTKDKSGNFWVYFGTGRYLSDSDKTFTYNNYLVGLMDDCWNGQCTNTYTLSQLYNATGATANIVVTRTTQRCVCNWGSCSNKEYAVDGYYNGTVPPNISRGWFHQLKKGSDFNELIYSQPFVFAGNLDVLVFRASNDICKVGGETHLLTVCYNTGIPCQKPSALIFEATSGSSITLTSVIYVAPGAPPLGQPFQVATFTPSTGQYEKIAQASYGVILRLTQQMQEGTRGRFILWLEK